jgi:hypothetical protein
MFNQQIIEINLKLGKNDQAYSVCATSRSRELLAIADQKYLSVYKNDKGNLNKVFLFTLNSQVRDVLSQQSTALYFQRDYLQIMSQDKIYRIKTGNSEIEVL